MNKLWRFGNRLSKMGGPHKISRIIEIINHILCSCSVSIEAEIGNGTVFTIEELVALFIRKQSLVKTAKYFRA